MRNAELNLLVGQIAQVRLRAGVASTAANEARVVADEALPVSDLAAAVGLLNAATATRLATARNFSLSGGGITSATVSFNGSAAVVLVPVLGAITPTSVGITSTFTTTGYPLSVFNAGYYHAYFQGTNANNQVSFYIENERGSFASYGGFMIGGSTSSLGNLFGVQRRDRLFMFADGTNNLGMYVGCLSNQPFVIGTNNTQRWQVSASGHFLAATDNTYDIGAAGASRPRTGYFGTSVFVGATKVLGAQGAAVTDAAAAAGAPTQAEFNALVTQFNALLARCRAHGLIA